MDAPSPLAAKVWRLMEGVPDGMAATYGGLAKRIGTSARAVGSAMAHNPWPDRFPCWRVVASDGSLGGYALGLEEKTRRLRAAGIPVRNGQIPPENLWR